MVKTLKQKCYLWWYLVLLFSHDGVSLSSYPEIMKVKLYTFLKKLWRPISDLIIPRLLKHYVDFCWWIKTERYTVMKFMSHPVPIFRLLTQNFHVFSINSCGVMTYRRYPPSLSRGTSMTSCLFCLSLSNDTSHVFPNYSFSIERNRWRSFNYWSTIYSEHLGQTNYIYLLCRLHFKGAWLTPSQLKFMTVNIVMLFTQTLACTYSIIHRIRQPI